MTVNSGIIQPKNGNNPKCPSNYKQINKMWCIHKSRKLANPKKE